jgi:heme iron utilization protein
MLPHHFAWDWEIHPAVMLAGGLCGKPNQSPNHAATTRNAPFLIGDMQACTGWCLPPPCAPVLAIRRDQANHWAIFQPAKSSPPAGPPKAEIDRQGRRATVSSYPVICRNPPSRGLALASGGINMENTEIAALQALFANQPVAALSTLHQGEPAGSMVPFALLPGGRGFVIHVSRLATHTGDLLANPAVSLLVMAHPDATTSPLALPRISIQGRARVCPPDDPAYPEARSCYLAKLPESEELFSFQDFSLVVIEPRSLRFVAGFGRAMTLTVEQWAAACPA